MAKKGRTAKPKEFQNNPFRDLKGLPVSALPETAAPPPAPPEPKPAPAGGEGTLFAEEMERLGVARRPGAGGPETGASSPPPPVPDAPADADPEDEFIAALGQLDVTFRDELPEEEDLPRPAPRRMRRLRQGKLAPEDQLDLHGLSRQQALEKVRWFLEDAAFQGRRTVLIVTGRGKNSADGPVLREAVARYLREEGTPLVLEWGTAPPRHGGAGALVVFLREGPRAERP